MISFVGARPIVIDYFFMLKLGLTSMRLETKFSLAHHLFATFNSCVSRSERDSKTSVPSLSCSQSLALLLDSLFSHNLVVSLLDF
jgi:hypothetical protein